MNVLMYYECLTGGILAPEKRSQKPPWGTVGASVGALGRCLAAHTAFLGRLWRVLGDLGAISVDLGSSFVVLRSILVDLGSNLIDFGSNLVPLSVDFSAFQMLFRSSGTSRSQKSRTSFRLGMGESK